MKRTTSAHVSMVRQIVDISRRRKVHKNSKNSKNKIKMKWTTSAHVSMVRQIADISRRRKVHKNSKNSKKKKKEMDDLRSCLNGLEDHRQFKKADVHHSAFFTPL